MPDDRRFTDSFNHHADVLNVAAAAQDADDYNNATSGADVGRMRKHMGRGDTDPITGKKKSPEAQSAARSLEWLLLNDAAYARLYEGAVTAVQDAVQYAGEVLDRVLIHLAEMKNLIKDAMGKAAQLADETKVFRDKDGNVRDENGKIIAEDKAAEIVWRGDEPSYEEYLALVEQAAALDARANELRGIETELGGFQGELSEGDPAATPDRLDDIRERSGKLQGRVGEIEADLGASPDHHKVIVGKTAFEASADGSSLSQSLTISLGTNP